MHILLQNSNSSLNELYEVLLKRKAFTHYHKTEYYKDMLRDFITLVVYAADEKLSICISLPEQDSVKACEYLVNMCNKFISKVSELTGYDANYEPSQDEINDLIEDKWSDYMAEMEGFSDWWYEEKLDRYINYDTHESCDNNKSDILSKFADELEEKAYEEAGVKYDEKNQDAVDIHWSLKAVKNKVFKHIEFLKRRGTFLNDALKSDNKDTNPPISFKNYLQCDNKDQVLNKLSMMFNNCKGKQIAITLLALNHLNYINIQKVNKAQLYDAIRMEFGLDIGRNSGINFFLRNNEKDDQFQEAIMADVRMLE